MNNMSETEKAYLAGLIDGEGCIGIYVKPRTKYIYGKVVIQMTRLEAILWCYQKTGLGNSKRYSRPLTSNINPIYYWSVTGNDAFDVAEAVLPYLVLKNEQAMLLIEFFRMRREMVKLGLGYRRDVESKQLRFDKGKEYEEKMRALNRRG